MALTRAFLEGMGVEKEKINAIIEAHAETVDALKAQRDDYKAKAEEGKTTAAELEALKAEAEKNAAYKEKYEKISAEYDAYKADQDAKTTKEAKANAYKALLTAAGISEKRLDAVMKVTDLSTIELDKDGKLKNADKLTEGIKTEWADFIVTTNTQGAQTQTPPGGSTGAPNYENMSMEDYIAARSKK